MRIALCDDETAYHETIQALIREYKPLHPDISLSLSVFSSGKELLNHVDEYGGFDLYILDCIMPEMDGIETGLSLRSRGDNGMVMYLTTSADFALDSYQVNALNYLLKPVEKDSFFQNLDKAYGAFLRYKREVITVKTQDGSRILPVPDIRYAERTGKQIFYYLTNGVLVRSATFNSSFKKAAADLLTHEGMLLVGSSFVVNLSHVLEVKKYVLILSGDVSVPIPQRLYEEIKTQWADFWLGGGKYHAF